MGWSRQSVKTPHDALAIVPDQQQLTEVQLLSELPRLVVPEHRMEEGRAGHVAGVVGLDEVEWLDKPRELVEAILQAHGDDLACGHLRPLVDVVDRQRPVPVGAVIGEHT